MSFTPALQPQPPWYLPRHLEGSDQAAELPMEHKLPCNSGRQKVGSSGLHLCVHTKELRTCIKQHVLLQVYYPHRYRLSKKREIVGGGLATW